MMTSAIHGRSNHQAVSRAAATTGTPTIRCGAYAARHQRCSIDRPRSIASHGVRRRSAMAMLAGCTAASSEQEVGEGERPAGEADADLHPERKLGDRRPERLDEGGEHEH